MKTDVKSIIKTIQDDIRDARMQCDYAKKAAENGDPELAQMHKQDAQMRIDGLKRWGEMAKRKLGNDELGETIVDLFSDQREEIEKMINKI